MNAKSGASNRSERVTFSDCPYRMRTATQLISVSFLVYNEEIPIGIIGQHNPAIKGEAEIINGIRYMKAHCCTPCLLS